MIETDKICPKCKHQEVKSVMIGIESPIIAMQEYYFCGNCFYSFDENDKEVKVIKQL